MVVEKDEMNVIYKKIIENDEEYLKSYRFTLWVNLLGPKTSYREFRLHQVDDMEVFAIFGFKLLINGDQLLRHLRAFEVSRNVFVLKEAARDDDWKQFIKRVINGSKPRIILNSEFRRDIGLSENIADLDIFILALTKYD